MDVSHTPQHITYTPSLSPVWVSFTLDQVFIRLESLEPNETTIGNIFTILIVKSTHNKLDLKVQPEAHYLSLMDSVTATLLIKVCYNYIGVAACVTRSVRAPYNTGWEQQAALEGPPDRSVHWKEVRPIHS